jgi:hypothetical protein
MRTIFIRSLSIAALAFAAFAGSAVAQTQPSPILNTLEVQKLAKSAEPKDNARLAAHFSALADQYTAEAKRHTSMAKSFGINRNMGAGMPVHCTRIAELNTETATTLRDLATHHQKVAVGTSSIAPAGAAPFQGGRGAREPNEKELTALAAKANSVSDHRALEEYFLTAAKRYTAEANAHVALAQTYRGTRMTWAPAIHDHLADLARKSAKEATASAVMHKDMAGLGR